MGRSREGMYPYMCVSLTKSDGSRVEFQIIMGVSGGVDALVFCEIESRPWILNQNSVIVHCD